MTLLTDSKRAELEARIEADPNRDGVACAVMFALGWVCVIAGARLVAWVVCGPIFAAALVRYVRRELALGALIADAELRDQIAWTLANAPDARVAARVTSGG